MKVFWLYLPCYHRSRHSWQHEILSFSRLGHPLLDADAVAPKVGLLHVLPLHQCHPNYRCSSPQTKASPLTDTHSLTPPPTFSKLKHVSPHPQHHHPVQQIHFQPIFAPKSRSNSGPVFPAFMAPPAPAITRSLRRANYQLTLMRQETS